MIVVCGEALMDVFAHTPTPSGMTLDARMGGSPFNTAVALARLGQRVCFFGAVSLDALGHRLLEALREEGVDTSAVMRTAAPTTLSLVGIDTHGVPVYSFYGHMGADRQLGGEGLALLPSVASGIHVGSYTTVIEPVASTLRALVERESETTPISYDPNVRLNVEPVVERWRSMLDWMLPRTHLLKISDEDLALLRPGVNPDQFAIYALTRGVKLVVVTLGRQGAIAWSGSATARVSAVQVSVVDTVGAGDSFHAALLTWLVENDLFSIQSLSSISEAQLKDALQFAASAAAITCSRRGANPPYRSKLC